MASPTTRVGCRRRAKRSSGGVTAVAPFLRGCAAPMRARGSRRGRSRRRRGGGRVPRAHPADRRDGHPQGGAQARRERRDRCQDRRRARHTSPSTIQTPMKSIIARGLPAHAARITAAASGRERTCGRFLSRAAVRKARRPRRRRRRPGQWWRSLRVRGRAVAAHRRLLAIISSCIWRIPASRTCSRASRACQRRHGYRQIPCNESQDNTTQQLSL